MSEVSTGGVHATPNRVALLGLPRCGTTWSANLLSAHPAVSLVNEPDNRTFDVLGWLGTGRLGVVPCLSPGDRASEYRTMWRIAFAGGWPEAGTLGRATRALRRTATNDAVPHRLRVAALLAAGRLAAQRRPAGPLVLVKSVRAEFAVDWLVREFDPAVLVVWRHPLNVVSSWIQKDWQGSHLNDLPPVRDRFSGTGAWPPPSGGAAAAAWTICANLTILLESVERLPGALVVNHERNTQDPENAAATILSWLGLDWHEAVQEFIAENDRPGEGWDIQRRMAEEPTRWRARLSPEDAREVLAVVERFQSESAVAAAAWPACPAVAS
ncbi:MAG: hypothetical protein QOH79_1376 [Acidimicrobiaceae bacterium]